MCGIFGFNFSDKKLAVSMCKILHHRGPDDHKIFSETKLTLGYTRLSIIDLKTGNQPIFNEDQSILVFFNGEIYNFKEIKENLEKKGHRFSTNTDTEVIVHSYEEYGKNCLKYFNGMFAFVIYDMDKKELFIARDRLGVKPLYYYFDNSKFLFASEIKAILEFSEVKREINYDSLNGYFTFRYCPGENTILKDIKRLLPGHYIVYKNNKLSVKKYWDMSFFEGKETETYYEKNFLELFETSVKYRMISDVPIGALLSGGIDSSSIVAMMAKNSEETINTYTIGFDEGFKNEFKYAKIISDKFNTSHKEFVIDSSSVKYLPKIVWHLDEPLADPTAIPNYILSEKASKKVKVLLNGDGADEFFGGYEQYKIMALLRSYNKLPKPVRSFADFSLKLLPKEPFFDKIRGFVNSNNNELKSYIELTSISGTEEKKAIFNRNVLEKIDDSKIYSTVKPYFNTPKKFLNKMLNTDIKTYLADNMLMKFDKITMAKSVEGRVPFCDYRLAEFSASLPIKLKLNSLTEKYIIRKAMSGILPKEIVKKKKQRFLVPTDNWLKRDFGEFSRSILENNKQITLHFFDDTSIKKLYSSEKYLSHKLLKMNTLTKLYYSRQLWTITNFVLWYDIFINDNKKQLKNFSF